MEIAESGEEVHSSTFDVDTTDLPFVINVVNPNKGKYFAPPCRICGMKNCNNCALPLDKKQTLR